MVAALVNKPTNASPAKPASALATRTQEPSTVLPVLGSMDAVNRLPFLFVNSGSVGGGYGAMVHCAALVLAATGVEAKPAAPAAMILLVPPTTPTLRPRTWPRAAVAGTGDQVSAEVVLS